MCWRGDAIYERVAGVLRECAEYSELLIVNSRSVREVSVVLVLFGRVGRWVSAIPYGWGLVRGFATGGRAVNCPIRGRKRDTRWWRFDVILTFVSS